MSDYDAQLIADSMSTIDLFLDTYEAYTDALIRQDAPTAARLRPELRAAWAQWGALVINRADGRTARMLVDMFKQLEGIREALNAQAEPLRLLASRVEQFETRGDVRTEMLQRILERLDARPVLVVPPPRGEEPS
jgi:hypothetical protein